jgi:hypothetical protein
MSTCAAERATLPRDWKPPRAVFPLISN